jgi:hypothetical protein
MHQVRGGKGCDVMWLTAFAIQGVVLKREIPETDATRRE